MTIATFSATSGTTRPATDSGYRPGVCNIGPQEQARRRRAGHVGLAASVILLVVLVAIGAPPITRLLIALPAAGAASGYLQAWLKFCAAYGRLGVYNFGRAGRTSSVAEGAARAADRRKANQIGLASLGIGLVVAVIAVLLPV